MMAVDLQPFSIVDDSGFCPLMREAEPRYMIPSRKYVSDILMPQVHSKVTHLVSQLLKFTLLLLTSGPVVILIIPL